jgi:hypothetical protein
LARAVFALAGIVLIGGVRARGQAVHAEAETSVVRGGLKWTLSVYQTAVHRRDRQESVIDLGKVPREQPLKADGTVDNERSDLSRYTHIETVRKGDPLWIKITVTNVGQKDAWISDDIMTGRGDFLELMGAQIANEWPPYIGMSGPDHKRVEWQKKTLWHDATTSQSVGPVDPVLTEKVRAWRLQGVSDQEIQERLNSADRRRGDDDQKRFAAAHPSFFLKPGKSVSSGPWVYPGDYPGERPQLPAPVGDFAELWNYHLDRPGTYKIWLVVKGGRSAPISIKALP